MTNEITLLKALMDGRAIDTDFQPQNNVQAYLASLCGLDIALPEPRTAEEALLYSLCVNGGVAQGGGNRPAVNVSYWNFQREGMVEMFNAMPDISADTSIAKEDKTIIITGNPCVVGKAVFAEGVASAKNYEELSTIFKDIPLDAEFEAEVNNEGMVWYASLKVALEQLQYAPYPLVISWSNITYSAKKLTDEDRAIATDKGWILVEA